MAAGNIAPPQFAPSNEPLKSLLGTAEARFTNSYCPMFNRPYVRGDLNSGVVLDPELTALLEQDRRSEEMLRHHKRKDDLKSYMDEQTKYRSVSKVATRKKGS